ncbi:MAG TPA: alpha-amylase/4-alpha-glucanotransferase domain-containing protein [Syntrophorhabdaceae bacterium]|nr:alpha-amylase/4-alpha-glucanotransferase domain-containing protein [Syntrophorhabdaceae bacterium]
MNLILCIHNHQPVGNMDYVLEEAYTKAYMPFFDVLREFPDIKLNIHFSGYLFSWLIEHKPDYVKMLRALKEAGQLEIMSGAMYEPVLALLSEDDGIAQISMHQDMMESVFGDRPRGMWLAERVYEPQIPRILNKAAIGYTVVDDNHFTSVGFEEQDLFGHYITDYEGHPLLVFPCLEFLRYAIPFRPLRVVDEYFRAMEKRGDDLAVFGDDGEKFGLWPGTNHSVYEENWLKSFFQYLSENSEWIKTCSFKEYIAANPPKGTAYLECASYKEMGEWCLPAKRAREYSQLLHAKDLPYSEFLTGGYYKNFLVKYHESNDMHKKMFRLSRKAKENEEARRHVMMAQANDSYWHGVFGGLYLPHLRASVYTHLIEAQKLLDPKESFAAGYIEDVNMDGYDEAVLSNNLLEASFFPKEGGILYGLDYKPSSVNVLATLQRRYEGYHEKIKEAVSPQAADGKKTIHDLVIAREEGLERYLHYDWYRRGSLIDHIFGEDVSLDTFYKSAYVEPADFVKEPYKAAIEKSNKSIRLNLSRNGHFWKNGTTDSVNIEKNIIMRENEEEIAVEYLISGDAGPFLLGIENNFAFLGSGGDRYMETSVARYALTTNAVLPASERLSCFDPYQNIRVSLEWSVPKEIWSFPVEVVSLSEQGFERNYQSTMIMPLWLVDLSRGPMSIHLRIHLQQIRKT